MVNDKYKNLTLITLNNTPHIKADNLEPIEVDSSCIDSFYYYLVNGRYKYNSDTYLYKKLSEGINISELADRIEVRKLYAQQQESEVDIEYYRAFLLPSKEDKVITFTINNENVNEDLKEEVKILLKEPAIWLTDPSKVNVIVNSKFEPTDNTTYHNPRYTIEEIERAIELACPETIISPSKVHRFKTNIINHLKK